jgi:hypothetical protein
VLSAVGAVGSVIGRPWLGTAGFALLTFYTAVNVPVARVFGTPLDLSDVDGHGRRAGRLDLDVCDDGQPAGVCGGGGGGGAVLRRW